MQCVMESMYDKRAVSDVMPVNEKPHTFSNRLSAYTSSACRSTGVMLLINPTPEVLREPTTSPASRVGSEAAFFLCWLAMEFPCRT